MRAAVYLRVSLDHTGEALAVERQREDCLRIAASRGWIVADIYVDNSISATDAAKVRPSYDRMVSDYEAGQFDALICWDLDRLTRQPRQMEDWIERAEKRGLAIVTANGEADLTTDAGRLFARIKLAVARSEVDRKGARQSRAQRQRAEMGRPAKGVRLTGYTLAGEVIADEAQLVRTIFDRFTAGDSLHGIAAWLQAEGFETRRGGRWSSSTVSSILRNRRYAGRSIYKGEDVGTASWPALVSETQFGAAHARLVDPARVTNHTDRSRRWLGSGLYWCECGLRMRTSSGTRRHRYNCRNECFYRTGWAIDDMVLKLVRARLARPDLAALMAGTEGEDRLAELAADRDRLTLRIQTVEADYDAGLIDGRRYQVAMEKARDELTGVRQAESKLIATTGPASIFTAPDPVVAFDNSPLGIQQRAVDVLMRVTLHPVSQGRKLFDPDSVSVEWR
jgi:DNA invertase Pin-like site-specific DNA recombinase